MSYKITLTKHAVKDYETVKKSPYLGKVKSLLIILEENPYEPPFEELANNLKGIFSRRINKQHRLTYEIDEESKTIKIRSMWTHYEKM